MYIFDVYIVKTMFKHICFYKTERIDTVVSQLLMKALLRFIKFYSI